MQYTGVSPGEIKEVKGWEAYHSTQSLQAEATETPTTIFRRITAIDQNAWQDFDMDIVKIRLSEKPFIDYIKDNK